VNLPAVPTKRVALLGCLALLAACAPRAADSSIDAVDAAPPASSQGDVAAADRVTDAPAAAAPAVDAPSDADSDPSGGMPDLDELEQARAAAGCAVSNDIGDLDDIRIYCQMPADVRAFLERENTCQHFAGEEAYDEARRLELETASERYCDGRERIFADLYERHHDDCALREALIGVGNRYDLFTDVAADHCRPQDVR
jgi:hypothetical protein